MNTPMYHLLELSRLNTRRVPQRNAPQYDLPDLRGRQDRRGRLGKEGQKSRREKTEVRRQKVGDRKGQKVTPVKSVLVKQKTARFKWINFIVAAANLTGQGM